MTDNIIILFIIFSVYLKEDFHFLNILFFIASLFLLKKYKLKISNILFLLTSLMIMKSFINPFHVKDVLKSEMPLKIYVINSIITFLYILLLKRIYKFEIISKIEVKEKIKSFLISISVMIFLIWIRDKYIYTRNIIYDPFLIDFKQFVITIIILFAFMFNSALIEEIVFRKILIDEIELRLSNGVAKYRKWIPFLISTMIFIYLHSNNFFNIKDFFVYMYSGFVLSILSRVLYIRTKSLLLCGVLHVICNFYV